MSWDKNPIQESIIKFFSQSYSLKFSYQNKSKHMTENIPYSIDKYDVSASTLIMKYLATHMKNNNTQKRKQRVGDIGNEDLLNLSKVLFCNYRFSKIFFVFFLVYVLISESSSRYHVIHLSLFFVI